MWTSTRNAAPSAKAARRSRVGLQSGAASAAQRDGVAPTLPAADPTGASAGTSACACVCVCVCVC
eukprot:CAMPEP_0117577388 /NCGR_PEP_ID=MMETSP0784-20121206/63395_1 /TAXON_ID=39447 /ORGANISM="" /LENGTH=64 /DNA_ID=CAMNT_0005376885 /DNA_START=261 /DNA_END=452 /DNA_ORIENTATION=+